ncbi:phytanoyl-CoA dioxygenase PhyH [Chitinophaga skermanii]|uniref:Phytanoyl-CoA dioxygenase PhyH n=1 Tax=Chitinophaga skermanii TaxID=331697 RepID=A0A327Q4M0_9BACT|nr:phytanoyl-CoA dioxygenase PhyH [Chitinophaga skermanii]
MPAIYTRVECAQLMAAIEEATQNERFRRSNELFAIRRFLHEVPAAWGILNNAALQDVLASLSTGKLRPVKSIYFDKPGGSNWFVSYHHDLTISVTSRHDVPGFGPWTKKPGYFAVQPPLSYLQNIFTLRIHLDDTNEENGALRVVPSSHNKGLYRPETIDWTLETEDTCCVEAGGIMIMKPLLLHASGRTTNQASRRVIHIEFTTDTLPAPLTWEESL